MPGLASLSKSFISQVDKQRAQVVLIGIDEKDESLKTPGLTLQYFPETYSDTKAINYRQIDIPGGSLPIYQWISSGERAISFTAYFTSDVEIVYNTQARSNIIGQAETQRNVDVRMAMAWLRSYTLPTYSGGYTYAPRKLVLFIPNSGLGLIGGAATSSATLDPVMCVMTQCDFTVEASFPSGSPRIATAQLSFAQIAQFKGDVQFPTNSEIDAQIEFSFSGRTPKSFSKFGG